MIKVKDPKQFMHVSFLFFLIILFAATPVVSALMEKNELKDQILDFRIYNFSCNIRLKLF